MMPVVIPIVIAAIMFTIAHDPSTKNDENVTTTQNAHVTTVIG